MDHLHHLLLDERQARDVGEADLGRGRGGGRGGGGGRGRGRRRRRGRGRRVDTPRAAVVAAGAQVLPLVLVVVDDATHLVRG